jgi:putative MATE family efflux protein
VADPVTNLLDQSIPASRVIWYLAWPSVAEQILQTMVNYIDTAMVGSLGAQATASIAINNSLIWLVSGLMNAAALGFSVQVAREVGLGNIAKVKRIVRQAMLIALLGGLGITVIIQLLSGSIPVWLGADPAILDTAVLYLRIIAAAYLFNMVVVFCGAILRGSGDTRTPMACNITANLLNIVGNYFLIFPTRQVTWGSHSWTMWGAGLGVAGAAISTALSFVICACLLLAALFLRTSPVQIKIKGSLSFDRTVMRHAWKLGAPAAYERMILSSGQLIITKLVAGLGTTSLAAYFLTNTAEAISYLPGFGFSIAATTLTAQALGAGEKELAHKFSKLCIRYGILLMGLAGLLMFVFSRPLVGFFTPDQEVLALGSKGLKIMAVSEPFFAMSVVVAGVLRGAGDSKWPFYITAMGMWGVRLLSLYLLCYTLGLGVYGAWIAMVLDIGTRGIISWWRYKQGNWLKSW